MHSSDPYPIGDTFDDAECEANDRAAERRQEARDQLAVDATNPLCPTCGGYGIVVGAMPPCPTCHGSGIAAQEPKEGER